MISLDVYPDSLLSFHKINHVDDLVRCLRRFPSLCLLMKSTMLMISLDVYADSPLSLSFNEINHVDDFVKCLSRLPSLSLLMKQTNLMISSDVYPDSPLSRF